MADQPLPAQITQWIQQQNWGMHHLEWHVTRLWDAVPDAAAFAQQQGWSRANIQEGAAGNGLEFLAMHRVMIRTLVAEFPRHSGLFRGWLTPPTQENDPNDPIPGNSPAGGPFPSEMLAAIAKVQGPAQSFADDDDFGRYVETSRRPTANQPGNHSSDRSTGVHNYLHERFTDTTSPIDMGNPQVNLLNQRFWRLHGWIDSQWSRVRQAKGLSEDQPAYKAALQEAEHHMGLHMLPTMIEVAFDEAARQPIPVPVGVQSALFSWGGPDDAVVAPPAGRAAPVARAGAAGPPTWEGDPGANNGIKNMFTAVDIAHMKSDIVKDMTGTIYLLDDYDDVKNNAFLIYGMVKNQRMPPKRPWSPEMLLKFKAWMDAGFPKG
jgi:hypothetical protein